MQLKTSLHTIASQYYFLYYLIQLNLITQYGRFS